MNNVYVIQSPLASPWRNRIKRISLPSSGGSPNVTSDHVELSRRVLSRDSRRPRSSHPRHHARTLEWCPSMIVSTLPLVVINLTSFQLMRIFIRKFPLSSVFFSLSLSLSQRLDARRNEAETLINLINLKLKREIDQVGD